MAGSSAARLTALALLVLPTLTAPLACRRDETAASPPALASGASLVLVTLDTVRADHLPPFGGRGAATPALSALAADGVLFQQAFSPAPLTLPAHVSLMTGLDPFRHGVRDNGGDAFDGRVPTLAERLRARGYATGAFVSAFVLDRRWGLSRGFDVYDDRLDVRSASSLSAMGRVQRKGGETWTAAKQWLDGRQPGQPFFLWLHLFDAHAPYEAPEPFRTQYAAQPYDGEIAYVDSIVGALLDTLNAKGLAARTVVSIVADHGESLGEHGEAEHGLLAYDATLHVPWLLRLPNGDHRGARIATPVSLVDVMPTLLDIVGAGDDGGAGAEGRDGRSQARLVASARTGTAPDRSRGLYAESEYPRLRFGWSGLAVMRSDRYKYIRAPQPELYDYVADPHETRNLAAAEPDVVRTFDGGLTKALARPAPARRTQGTDASAGAAASGAAGSAASPSVEQQLRALGYVAGPTRAATSAAQPGTLRNPAAMVGTYQAMMRAGTLLLEQQDEAAGLPLLASVLRDDPALEPAHRIVRSYWAEPTRAARGERWIRGLRSTAPPLLVDLAAVQHAAGRRDAALATIDQALAADPRNVPALLLQASWLRERGRADAALAAATRAVAVDGSADARLQVAQALVVLARLPEAEAVLRDIDAQAPQTAGVHYLRALVAEQRGDGQAAIREYEQEIAASPWDFQSRFNLALLLGQRGDREAQIAMLMTIPPLAPRFAEVHFYLAKALLDTGDPARRGAALAAAAKGLALGPRSPMAALGHYVQADVYALEGRRAEAAAALARGRAAERAAAAP